MLVYSLYKTFVNVSLTFVFSGDERSEVFIDVDNAINDET